MPPVYFGKNLRRLAQSQLETKLSGAKLYTKKLKGWSKKAEASGIFFDLSKVEWVELGATAQLILLIESALRHGIRVDLALPLPTGRKSEIAFMKANHSYANGVQRRINNRKAVFEYLTHLRFQEALAPHHLQDKKANLNIIKNYDSSVTETETDEGEFYPEVEQEEQGLEELKNPEKLYNFCFPFCWISPDKDPSQIRNLSKFISNVTRGIDETHHGIEAIDADTIANVILYELVDNAIRHSREKEDKASTLIAARVRPYYTPPCNENFLEVTHPYINWLTQKQASIVEIVVGDSGHGIRRTLENSFNQLEPDHPAKLKYFNNKTTGILLWAFDRWSSGYDELSSKRGTRGLYRVDRIVKKYEGLITLRSDSQLVGLDHGGPSYDGIIPQPNSKQKRLSYIPGTLLNLWLPPFHEQPLPRKVPTEIKKDLAFKVFDLGVALLHLPKF